MVRIMNWNTIYIKGRSDFREEVRRKLEHSSLRFMPGYIESISGESDLYWIDEKITLRKFKEAIGSKLIWKHRLTFYTSLELFIESQHKSRNLEFTPEERELIELMKSA